MNFKKFSISDNQWYDVSCYIRKTATDNITSLPTTIYGDGTNASLTIKGNTVQNGTPTPSNPVSVDGVGELETSGEHAGDYKIPISCGNVTTLFYLSETQSTRQIKKLVLDGTENWSEKGSGDSKRFQFQLEDYHLETTALCSHFNYASVTQSGTETGFYIVPSGAMVRIRPVNVSSMSLSDFTTFLANQYSAGTPVTLYYVIDTQTTTSLNEPLRKIGDYADSVSPSAIPTVVGSNTLSVGTTVQPSEVTATYKGWHPIADVHERTNDAWT